jgi:tricarballylate dehydrogenase
LTEGVSASAPPKRAVDVAVLGGGNAGLCAALAARQRGASVVVFEGAPKEFRGGNSRHTRNLRSMHEGPTDLLADAYAEDEFLGDLVRVTGGRTNEVLAQRVVRGSADCPAWIRSFGARLQRPLAGTLHLDRTNVFFLGGGKALMNTYYAAAERLGVRVVYDADVAGLDVEGSRFKSVSVRLNGGVESIAARAVVLAAGGFESNLDWLKRIWGPAADNFIIRGTPYNTGTVLKLMLDHGAQPVGDPTQFHCVAVDARAPKFDGGIVTRLDCVSLGIVVNRDAERFYDEGEDFWPKRYAVWGRLVALQPDQIAYAIVDAKSRGLFMPSVFPPIEAHTIRELANRLNLSPDALERTVTAFNSAVKPGGFDHAVLDGCRTQDLTPPKSHWARALDTPPFWAYPLRPGVTFTYLGLAVDERARVLMSNGKPADNIVAAGEIMAGNILGQGYVAGVGMTIGTVFGRIAGAEAARHAVA